MIIKRLTLSELDALIDYLKCIQFDFNPPLFERINEQSNVNSIEDYAYKLLLNANVFAINFESEDNILGVIAIYTNNTVDLKAYIPILSVKREYSGRGIAKKLLKAAINLAFECGMHSIDVKTWPNNEIALKLYLGFGFTQTSIDASNIYLTKQIK